jgi:hypothetical protein
MKDLLHCYHIDFTHETETCCWCSASRKLRFGQGHFDRDVGMTSPLISIWWWRYNGKMYDIYQRIMQSGTPEIRHGSYRMHQDLFVEYADEQPCLIREQSSQRAS